MLGKLLARGAAATHRQAALTSRRSRITSACLQGAHAPTAGAAGAAGLQRRFGTAIDDVDDGSGLGGGRSEAVGQHEVGAEAQRWQGQLEHGRRRPVAGARAAGGEDGRKTLSVRQRDTSYSHGRGRGRGRGGGGGGRGGRGWGGRGGEFARSGTDRNNSELSHAWQYAHNMGELRRTGNWMGVIEAYKQACDDESVAVDRIMYNTTVVALARSPKWKVALSILQEMRDDDTVAPDTYTFNAALMACVHGRQADLAFALLGEMRGVGVEPDGFTFSHLVSVCGQEGKWETALSLVDEMKRAGLRPNCVTYNSVIVALGNGGEPDRAVEVLDTMREEGVQISEGSYSAAIAACGKAGGWERALHLLEEMKEGRDNLAPNEYCYNSAISGEVGGDMVIVEPVEYSLRFTALYRGHVGEGEGWCCRPLFYDGSARSGVCVCTRLFLCVFLVWRCFKIPRSIQYMKMTGLTPVPLLLTLLELAACERAAKWQEALTLLRDMQEAQLVVTGGTYTHVLKACTNAGEIEEARALLAEMRTSGMWVKQGTVAMVEKSAERRSARRSRNNDFSPAEAAAAAAYPENRAGVDVNTAAARLPQPAAGSWIDVLPTPAARSSSTPLPSEYQPLRPTVEEPATTSADTANETAAEANTGGGTDAADTAADVAGDVARDAEVSSASAAAAATTAPVLPSTASTAAAAARFSGRAAEMVAARPPRSRSVRDFIRGVGGHSRNARWSEIMSDLDKATADPNTKVRCGDANRENGVFST